MIWTSDQGPSLLSSPVASLTSLPLLPRSALLGCFSDKEDCIESEINPVGMWVTFGFIQSEAKRNEAARSRAVLSLPSSQTRLEDLRLDFLGMRAWG